MIRKSMLLAALLACFVLLCAPGPCLAFGVKARLPGVFVVGNQIYEGGELTLRTVSQGDLVSLEVNGRPIALFTPVFKGNRASDARPEFVFRRDERGFLHLAYLAFNSEKGLDRQVISFRITALARGIATLPNHPPYGETLYFARR